MNTEKKTGKDEQPDRPQFKEYAKPTSGLLAFVPPEISHDTPPAGPAPGKGTE